jgi:hypothetical protein
MSLVGDKDCALSLVISTLMSLVDCKKWSVSFVDYKEWLMSLVDFSLGGPSLWVFTVHNIRYCVKVSTWKDVP